MKKQIGDRMKYNYEEAYKVRLPMRIPIVIRLDGKNFHTYTKKMKRPYDEDFINNMVQLSQWLCKEIQTAQFTYVQSDEISIFLHSYKKLDSEPWFNNEIQKIVSVSAGMASAYFTDINKRIAVFDSRVFIIPETELVNYFIWRQQDATRNSISMLAQSKFSHKQLLKKNTKEMQEMIFQKDGTNWNNLPTYLKRGIVSTKESIDLNIPIFTQNRDYINKFLKIEED